MDIGDSIEVKRVKEGRKPLNLVNKDILKYYYLDNRSNKVIKNQLKSFPKLTIRCLADLARIIIFIRKYCNNFTNPYHPGQGFLGDHHIRLS